MLFQDKASTAPGDVWTSHTRHNGRYDDSGKVHKSGEITSHRVDVITSRDGCIIGCHDDIK